MRYQRALMAGRNTGCWVSVPASLSGANCDAVEIAEVMTATHSAPLTRRHNTVHVPTVGTRPQAELPRQW